MALADYTLGELKDMSKDRLASVAKQGVKMAENAQAMTEILVEGAEIGGGMFAGGFLQAKGWNVKGYTYDKIGSLAAIIGGVLGGNTHAVRIGMGLAAPTIVGFGAKAAAMGNPFTKSAGDEVGDPRQLGMGHENVSAEHGADIVRRLQSVRR